jgi:hypothetical protein
VLFARCVRNKCIWGRPCLCFRTIRLENHRTDFVQKWSRVRLQSACCIERVILRTVTSQQAKRQKAIKLVSDTLTHEDTFEVLYRYITHSEYCTFKTNMNIFLIFIKHLIILESHIASSVYKIVLFPCSILRSSCVIKFLQLPDLCCFRVQCFCVKFLQDTQPVGITRTSVWYTLVLFTRLSVCQIDARYLLAAHS